MMRDIGLKEGDMVDVQRTPEGQIVITPQSLMAPAAPPPRMKWRSGPTIYGPVPAMTVYGQVGGPVFHPRKCWPCEHSTSSGRCSRSAALPLTSSSNRAGIYAAKP
jgi:hypothetical protein